MQVSPEVDDGKNYFVLVDGKIQRATMLEASRQLEGKKNQVQATDLDGEVSVSTVFLGIDHGWGKRPLPVLFETMVFGGKFDNWQWRYCTLEEAQVGHQIVVTAVKAGIEPEIPDRHDPRWVDEFYKMYTGEEK